MIVNLILKFIGNSREHIIGFLFDWGYISFSEAARILDSASGAWEHSYGITQIGEAKIPKEHFIQQKLICAIQPKEDSLKIYYEDSSHRKFQVLQRELEELGIDHHEYLRFFVKKSELYKYIQGQISNTKAYNKIHNKIEELKKNGHIFSHEFIELKEKEDSLSSKIENYIYK